MSSLPPPPPPAVKPGTRRWMVILVVSAVACTLLFGVCVAAAITFLGSAADSTFQGILQMPGIGAPACDGLRTSPRKLETAADHLRQIAPRAGTPGATSRLVLIHNDAMLIAPAIRSDSVHLTGEGKERRAKQMEQVADAVDAWVSSIDGSESTAEIRSLARQADSLSQASQSLSSACY